MGEVTAIAWTDHTFNAWIGCAKVSAECKHCYAEIETFARRERARGLELWGANAARHVTSDATWKNPRAWNRAAEKAGVRRRVFCSSMSDVFEDRKDLDLPRARLWKLIRETPWLDWLLLTKRPEEAARLWQMAALAAQGLDVKNDAPAWLPNIWLGTTAGTQEMADERIPHLLRVPARVRFLSCEPLLEEVLLHKWFAGAVMQRWLVENPDQRLPADAVGKIDWVIGGGESGPKARICDVDWLRSLRGQCAAAGVPYFNKQLGSRAIDTDGTGWKLSKLDTRRHPSDPQGLLLLNHKKGGDPDEWPEDLRVREFPTFNDVREATARP